MSRQPCVLCGSPSRAVPDPQFAVDYFRCDRCDLIFLDPDACPSEEAERAEYLLHDNSRSNEGYVRRLEGFVRACVEPFGREVKRILDFGCGPEPVLAGILRERGFEVDVYDPFFHPEQVFAGRRYDLVTATEVAEHLRRPLETFQLVRQLLDRGGKIAMTTLFHPGDDRAFQGWWYRRETSHVTFYSEITIATLAEVLGLQVLMTDGESRCVIGEAITRRLSGSKPR